MGPWDDEAACLLDPAMQARYPGDEQRKRVCGALKSRLGDSTESTDTVRVDAAALVGKVTRGDGFAIIHDAIAAREGVNDRGEFKPWKALKAGASSMEGVPLTYGHPPDPRGGVLVEVPTTDAVGFAVNIRADDDARAIRYDALVLLAPVAGLDMTPADLERNAALVAFVEGGGVADNSVGYYTTEHHATGTHDGVHFETVQEELRFGHVAILRPFTREAGACASPSCGVGLDHAEGTSCKGGDGCCKTRMEAAIKQVQAATGASRAAALMMARQARKV